MLGDVGQPQLVRPLRGEAAQHPIVVHRRTGAPIEAALAGVHRPDPLGCAEPVDAVAGRPDAFAGELVGDEPVAELGVVVVDVDRGVDQVRVVPVPLADRLGAPLELHELAEPEHQAGQHDGDTLVGQVRDQREINFGRTSRAK